jgi:hypothetical protein
MNFKPMCCQVKTIKNKVAAEDITGIVYSCAGPRVVPEEDYNKNSLIGENSHNPLLMQRAPG